MTKVYVFLDDCSEVVAVYKSKEQGIENLGITLRKSQLYGPPIYFTDSEGRLDYRHEPLQGEFAEHFEDFSGKEVFILEGNLYD